VSDSLALIGLHTLYSDRKRLHISKLPTTQSQQVVNGWPNYVASEFDGLSILRFISEDSIAAVFLAREVKPERLVALKVLKANFAADVQLRTRFQNCARAAASIVHPNVAAIYRVGERPDGLPYIVHEYIGGLSLADLLTGTELPSVDESTRIIVSLAKALAAALVKGIVHRDVVPRNVVIEQDSGRVVLTNFEAVGPKEEGSAPSPELLSRYVSPETLSGDAVTAASNIFSLGAIADELHAARGPKEFGQVLRRCVDTNPTQRPTAEEVVRQLTIDAPAEVPLNPVPPTQRAAESSLMRVAVIAGLLIMALGAAVGFWVYDYYSQ